MAKHWSEILECSCGKRFRSAYAESVHRHNFPSLCNKPKGKYGPRNRKPNNDGLTETRAQLDELAQQAEGSHRQHMEGSDG